MQRFYLPPEHYDGDYIISQNKDFLKQLASVLRAKEGEKFMTFNGNGREQLVQLLSLDKRGAKFLIIDDYPAKREPVRQVHLFVALVKADKLEWVAQKAVELGVASITPMACDRCITKNLSPNKLKRLNDIIIEAAEQCGGCLLPALNPVLPYRKALFAAEKNGGQRLIAWEEETKNKLADFKSDQMNLFIGPEGGFSGEEIDVAQGLGFGTVSLGRRILRAETASIAALASLLIE